MEGCNTTRLKIALTGFQIEAKDGESKSLGPLRIQKVMKIAMEEVAQLSRHQQGSRTGVGVL